MNRKPLPPQHLLRERFDYDAEIGHLINKKNMRGRGGGIGSIVGKLHHAGYRQVKFNGQLYSEHNLIWMWYYGEEIPSHLEVDHIDNDRDNNRIENLRLVSHSDNQMNRRDTKENGKFGHNYYYRNGLPVPDEVREEYNKRQRKAKRNKGE